MGQTSPTAAGHLRHLGAEERKRRVLELAAQGKGPVEFCAIVGMSTETLRNWRRRDPRWWEQYQAVRRSVTETPEVREERRKAGYNGGFIEFRRHYLGMDTTWFQAQIAEAITRARPGEVTLILIPPGHGKTTELEDFCTWRLSENSSYRITVGSETVDHGEKILDRVRHRFEPDGPTPQIYSDFPDTHEGETWGARKFSIAGKRTSDERDYSMSCVGLTGRVQGTRADLLLLDDIQDVKSLELSGKYYDLVLQSFISRPEMFGRTVIIGTRVGEFDVYRRLRDAEIPDHVITIPAYSVSESPHWDRPATKPNQDDPSTWAPEGVKFLWPEKYDQEEEGGRSIPGLHRFRYAKMRFQVGESAWWRIYMQRPEAASSMTFDEATTAEMFDEHRGISADPRPRTDGSPVPVIIGVDPAIGGGNGVLAAASYPTHLDVLHCRLDYELTKYSQIIDLIEEECHRYSTADSVVTTVVVEDKAFQKGILRDDRMIEVQQRFGFRIVPNTTGTLKKDPDIGIPGMPMSMWRHEIQIPWADKPSRDNMALLLDQLHIWRPGTTGNTRTPQRNKVPQDLVMTLWFVWGQWRATRDTVVHPTNDPSAFNHRRSPLRPPRPPGPSRRRRPYRSLRGGWR